MVLGKSDTKDEDVERKAFPDDRFFSCLDGGALFVRGVHARLLDHSTYGDGSRGDEQGLWAQ